MTCQAIPAPMKKSPISAVNHSTGCCRFCASIPNRSLHTRSTALAYGLRIAIAATPVKTQATAPGSTGASKQNHRFPCKGLVLLVQGKTGVRFGTGERERPSQQRGHGGHREADGSGQEWQ